MQVSGETLANGSLAIINRLPYPRPLSCGNCLAANDAPLFICPAPAYATGCFLKTDRAYSTVITVISTVVVADVYQIHKTLLSH